MDLTFRVPMQHCSLQHQTLLPSPVTSTTGCCFSFGSVSSFFLNLFLYWSPVVPEPAGKVDQVLRTCTTRLRKNTTAKMGLRGSDTTPQREAVWPRLYSASYIYTGEQEKNKTVNIFLGWPIHLTKSHKKSWEHGNGTLLLFLTPDNISLCVRSLSRTPGVCSK